MPSLPTRVPTPFEVVLPRPGLPGGTGGPGGPAPPSPSAGWEVFVYAAPSYSVQLCQVPQYMSLQFSKVLKDKGAGTIVLDLDLAWFATAKLGNGQLASTLFDDEHLWVVTQDGVRRFEFLAETITEQLADGSEQRTVTVTGPGTMQCLTWAAAMPPGFPNIIYKTDAIQDGFAEIDQNGNLQVDTSIWNVIQPASAVSLNPSGTLQLVASAATTYCGATPYNITSSLISAQVTPIGGGSSTGLDGSQLTQFYIQDTKNTSNYALIGLSATGLYCQVGDTVAGTNLTKPLGAYDAASQLYWQISEKNGSFYFWTSADGVTYTQEWVVPYKWTATKVTVYFAAKYDQANSQVMGVTNVNGNVVTPSSAGNIFFGEPIMGVWHDLLTAAQGRGTVPFITTQLSGTTDSFGSPWTDSNSVQIQNGTDLWALLQSHAAIVNADYVMQPGFLLQVGIPVTGRVSLGTDRSQQVILREAGAEISKSRVRDRSAIENLVGAVNSDGTTLSASDSSSIATWGQREGWVQTAVQVNPDSIAIAAAASIEETRDQKLSWTLSVTPDALKASVFRDYDVGDWVGLERPGPLPGGPDYGASTIDAIRVIAAAISIDATGQVTCELTVNSYLQWLQEQLQYLVNKMGGQFINSLGTTPVTSNASGPTQLPTIFAPNLGGMNDTLLSGLQHGASLVYNAVTGTWQPAASPNTENSDLTPVIVATPGGSVTIQPDAVLPPVVTTTDGQGNSVITTPTSHTVQGPTGQKVVVLPYAAQVVDAAGTTRAIVGSQVDGTVTVTTQNTPTPAAPDTPSVAGGPLGVYVGWDGLLGGAGPLQDFEHVEVHVGSASGFTPSSATLQGQMVAGGLYGVGGLAAGTTYFARLVAVSKSGARSAPSAQASAVPTGIATTPITGSQIANGTITSAQISAVAGILGSQLSGSAGITAGQVSFTARQIGGINTTVSSTAPSSPATGDLWFDGTNGYELKVWSGTAWTPFQYGTNAISAGSVTAALIAANTITAAQIAAGTITATEVAAGTITATQISAGTIDSSLLAAGIVVSGIINGTVVTGTTLQNSSTDPQTSVNPDGSFTITDQAGTVVFEIDPAGNVFWFGQSGQLQVTISNNGDYLIYQAPQGPDEWLFEPPSIPAILGSTTSAASAPSPAAYPSRLRCSGRNIVDSNGYVLPPMKGFVIQPVPFSAQTYLDIAAKGCTMVRTLVFWDQLEPTQGNIDATYVGKLDSHISRLQAAGLYTWLSFYFGPNGLHAPAWEGATSKMSAYVTYGQNATQYLANRYGNPVSAQYTNAVVGMGINEPAADATNVNTWVQTTISQQAQMATWMRVYAPSWIMSLCPPWSSSGLLPNTAISELQNQTYLPVSATPISGGNFWIEMHDGFWCTSNAANPDQDCRKADGEPFHLADGGTFMDRTDSTAYPPVISGTALTSSQIARMNTAYHSTYTAYCAASYANCPIVIGESYWVPTTNTGLAANVADKAAAWAAMGAVAVMQWDYNVSQTQDQFAARPGATAVGADPDGWQTWTNTFLAASLGGGGGGGGGGSTAVYVMPVTGQSSGGATVTVCTSSSGSDAPTLVSDSNGNNYVQIASTVIGKYQQLWQAQNCSVLDSTDKITVTYPAANTNQKNIVAVTADNVVTTGGPDAVNSAGGNSPAPAVSCVPDLVNDLLLLFVTNSFGGGNPVDPPDGWVRLGQVEASNFPWTTVWYSTNIQAAAVTGSCTLTGTTPAWAAAIVALASAAPVTPASSSGFGGDGATVAQSSNWSFDGDFSLKITQTGTSFPWGATSPQFAVSSGQPVTMQAELYTPAALPGLVAGFKWYDVNGALIGSATGDQGTFSTTAGEQLQVTITAATAPAAAVSASFFVQQGAGGGGGGGGGTTAISSSDAAKGAEGSTVQKPPAGTRRRVGVDLGNSTSNGDNTIAQFNTAVGSGFLHALHAFYGSTIPASISTAGNCAPGFSLSSAVGVYRVLIDFELTHYGSTTGSGAANTFVLGSGSNSIPSACVTEFGKLDTFIASCQSAGLDMRISLWHEPYSKFTSATIPTGTNPATGAAWTQQQANNLDYSNSIGYMGQVIRKHNLPVEFVPANYTANHHFSATIGTASTPGLGWAACSKGYIDEVMSDFYVNEGNSNTTPAGSGIQGTLDNCANLADAFGLALGFCELGFAPATASVHWNGTDVDAFTSYVLNFLSARKSAGKSISDIMVWATNDNATSTGMYLAPNWANTGAPAFGSPNTIGRYHTLFTTYDNGVYSLRRVATDFEPGIEVRQDPVTDPERQPGDYDPGSGPALRLVRITRRPGHASGLRAGGAVFGATANAVMQLDTVLVPGGLVYANSPTGGTDQYGNPYQSGITFIGLPAQQNVFSVQDPYGNTLAMVDSGGNIAGQTLSANTDIFLGGSSLTTDLLGALPNGVLALGSLDGHLNAPSTLIPTGTETSIFELDVQLYGGRCYRISLGSLMLNMTAVGRCDITVYATSNGTTPSTASPGFMLAYADAPFSNHLNLSAPTLSRVFQPASDMLVRMLVALKPVATTLSGASSNPTVQFMGMADSTSFGFTQQDPLVVEDIGPAVSDTRLYIGAGSGGGTGHQTITGVWQNTHTYSFWGDGSVRNTDGSCYQGQVNGGNSIQFSFIRFPTSAYSTLFAPGVTINSVKLTATNLHSWYSDGVTAILGVSQRSATPPNANPKISFPDGSDFPGLNTQDWREGVKHTVILPVSFLNHWANSATYVVLGNNQWTNLQYYGYWAGGPNSWTLTVSYTT